MGQETCLTASGTFGTRLHFYLESEKDSDPALLLEQRANVLTNTRANVRLQQRRIRKPHLEKTGHTKSIRTQKPLVFIVAGCVCVCVCVCPGCRDTPSICQPGTPADRAASHFRGHSIADLRSQKIRIKTLFMSLVRLVYLCGHYYNCYYQQ